MRASILLPILLGASACVVGGDLQADPPILEVTSPARSFVRDHAGEVVVTGRVDPNPTGAPVASVVVNGTPATLAPDGTFSAAIVVPAGATLIHTVASDVAGGLATDTRSFVAGERRPAGSSIEGAVGAAISPTAFGTISALATRALKSANLTQLIQPLNPVARAGDETGPDCLYAQGFIDSVTISDAMIALAPVAGGLQVTVRLEQPRITGRTQHAVLCQSGASTLAIRASSATLVGVVQVTPNGMNGFTTEIVDPVVQLPGLQIDASGVPNQILGILPLERIIQAVAPLAVKLFVNPMLNDALGALTQPQQLAVLGRNLTLQVAPRSIELSPTAGTALLDMRLLIEGASSPGFTFTPNGIPALDAGDGIGLAIADDLVNDVLAQMTSLGLLNVTIEQGGTTARIQATTPPMIGAEATDGRLRIILPDMIVSFLDGGTPVAQAAVNAEIPIALAPAAGGTAIGIELGAPQIAIDDLDPTAYPMAEAGHVIQIGANGQKGTIADVLGTIPLPTLAGVTLRDVSVSGGNGYVLATTRIE